MTRKKNAFTEIDSERLDGTMRYILLPEIYFIEEISDWPLVYFLINFLSDGTDCLTCIKTSSYHAEFNFYSNYMI